MRLESLSYYVAVVEQGSFTAAAKHLYVSQPAVSSAVQALETELNVRLLDRCQQGAIPTQAGAAVYRDAKTVLSALGRLRATANFYSGRRLISMAYIPALNHAVIQPFTHSFIREFPSISLDCAEILPDLIIEHVLQEHPDYALTLIHESSLIGLEDYAKRQSFAVKPLAADTFYFYIHGNLPYDENNPPTLDQLQELPFVIAHHRKDSIKRSFRPYNPLHPAYMHFSHRHYMTNKADVFQFLAETPSVAIFPSVALVGLPENIKTRIKRFPLSMALPDSDTESLVVLLERKGLDEKEDLQLKQMLQLQIRNLIDCDTCALRPLKA